MRIEKLRSILEELEIDAILVASTANIFYLTGIRFDHVGEAYLIVGRKFAYLFTNALNLGGVPESSEYETREVSNRNPIGKQVAKLLEEHSATFLGVEYSVLSHRRYLSFEKELSGVEMINVDEKMSLLRLVKDKGEIKLIEKACALTDLAFSYVSSRVEIGVCERELAWQFESFVRSHGGELAFSPIVAFGTNSAVPHHRTGEKKLKSSDKVILFDLGAKVNGYCSDLTRIVFVGEGNAQIENDYRRVLELQKYAIENVQAGMTLGELDAKVDKKRKELKLPTIPHSLGHGIGVEIHEEPFFSNPDHVIEDGMILTIEPGIYKLGKYGMRIEDTVVVEGGVARSLTSSGKDL